MSEFIDHLRLSLRAGNGGSGCVSFRREKFVPRGGPDGGNGGRGGHVIVRVDEQLNTLAHLRPNATIRAGRGTHGSGSNRTGAMGEDAIIPVPRGTIVRDADTGEVLGELLEPGEELIAAAGGKGGQGNAAFVRATRQVPMFAQPGEKGEQRVIDLELKLLADIGIIGLPNAGKSTLTRRISAARPEVADYPFTTLYPVLGVVNMGYESFVIADIPGLIEGAHRGAGLGHQFLRHIERTRVLLHIIDIGGPNAESPALQASALERELEQFREELSRKPTLLVGNKIDLGPDPDTIAAFESYARDRGLEYCLVSGATGEGVEAMLKQLLRVLQEARRED